MRTAFIIVGSLLLAVGLDLPFWQQSAAVSGVILLAYGVRESP